MPHRTTHDCDGYSLVDLLMATILGGTVAALVVVGVAGFPQRGAGAPSGDGVDTRLQNNLGDHRVRCSNNDQRRHPS